jgi:hypothetical protein
MTVFALFLSRRNVTPPHQMSVLFGEQYGSTFARFSSRDVRHSAISIEFDLVQPLWASGSVGTARHSMGSLNVAGHSGKDFSVRSSSPDVMLKIRTVGEIKPRNPTHAQPAATSARFVSSTASW